ncbi:MAG TPA: SDR family oxidoreductase [Ilumatobacteraceae bacterium]|nr:SDR family oxidoreductase [Ilumatobacteraceae bacterium]
MTPRSVLVTGASGYIGRQLVAALAAERGSIRALVAVDVREVPADDRLGHVVYRSGDVRDSELLSILREFDVDCVVHLAAIVTPGPNSSREFEYSVDVLGTQNVIDCCVEAGVRQLIVTSSGAAYGYYADNPVPLTEDDALRGNPEFAYADHKRQVEERLALARTDHPGLRQLIFRPGAILGATVSNQITDMFDKRYVLAVAGSDSPFSFVSDRDVVAALVKGIVDDATGIYNLVGGGSTSMANIAQRLDKRLVPVPAAALRTALRVLHRFGWSQYGAEQVAFLQYRPVLSNRRLIDEFGYQPASTSDQVFDEFVGHRARVRRVVVITGAAGGIGAALARRFAADGADLALLDLDRPDSLAKDLGEGGVHALPIRCDVTSLASCTAAVDQVIARFGGIDVLVANAGITHLGAFVDTDVAVIQRVMDVNFFGSVNITKAALESLLARRGQIVVMSSVAGVAPLATRSGYSASKHALHGFFESLRTEVASRGVAVTMVCPSFVRTGIGNSALGGDGGRATIARTQTGTPVEPDAVADVIVAAARHRRRLVLPFRDARRAAWLVRVAPRLYDRVMVRRLVT